MNAIADLKNLEEELNTHDYSSGIDKFRFIKKVYKIARANDLLNIRNVYDHIAREAPRQMDKEFMKMILSRLNKNKYQTPIAIFDEYWEDNMGLILKDGLSLDYSVSISDKSVFSVLLINNTLKDILLLLTVIAKRITKQQKQY